MIFDLNFSIEQRHRRIYISINEILIKLSNDQFHKLDIIDCKSFNYTLYILRTYAFLEICNFLEFSHYTELRASTFN